MKMLTTIHQFVVANLSIAITGLTIVGIICTLLVLLFATYLLTSWLFTKALRHMSPKAFYHSFVLVLSSVLVGGKWVDMHILKIVHLMRSIGGANPKMYNQIMTALPTSLPSNGKPEKKAGHSL